MSQQFPCLICSRSFAHRSLLRSSSAAPTLVISEAISWVYITFLIDLLSPQSPIHSWGLSHSIQVRWSCSFWKRLQGKCKPRGCSLIISQQIFEASEKIRAPSPHKPSFCILVSSSHSVIRHFPYKPAGPFKVAKQHNRMTTTVSPKDVLALSRPTDGM